jgi:hypothetical protein
MLVAAAVAAFQSATRLREQAEAAAAEMAQIQPPQALMQAQTPVVVVVAAGTLVGGLLAAQVVLALFLFVTLTHIQRRHRQQAHQQLLSLVVTEFINGQVQGVLHSDGVLCTT